MGTLKGILLDSGGTIVAAESFDAVSGFEAVVARLDLPRGLAGEDVVDFAVELEARFQGTRDATFLEFSFEQIFRIVIDYFQIACGADFEEMEYAYFDASATYSATDGVRNFLEGASAAGIPCAVISNSIASSRVLRRSYKEEGLSDFISAVISSADYGIRKQFPLLFDLALARLQLKREQVVFIGNHLDFDVSTANAAGITSVWYNPGGESAEIAKPDYSFSSWRDVTYASFTPLVKQDGATAR